MIEEQSYGVQQVSGPTQAGRWQLLVVLINVASGVITARLLGPEGGEGSAAVTFWLMIIATLAISGLPYALTYHLRHKLQRTRSILGAGLAFLGALTGMVVIPFAMLHSQPPGAAAFALVCVLFTVACLVAMLFNRSLGVIELRCAR